MDLVRLLDLLLGVGTDSADLILRLPHIVSYILDLGLNLLHQLVAVVNHFLNLSCFLNEKVLFKFDILVIDFVAIGFVLENFGVDVFELLDNEDLLSPCLLDCAQLEGIGVLVNHCLVDTDVLSLGPAQVLVRLRYFRIQRHQGLIHLNLVKGRVLFM